LVCWIPLSKSFQPVFVSLNSDYFSSRHTDFPFFSPFFSFWSKIPTDLAMTSPMDDVTLEPAASPTPSPPPAPLPLSFAQVASLGAQASIHAPIPGAGRKKSKSSGENRNLPTSSNLQSEIIPKSHSPYTLIADFTGFNLSQGQVTSLVSTQLSDVETLRFLKQGRAAEIGFLSREYVQAAITSGLIFEERQVPLTRCFAVKHNVVAITIRGLPCYSKKETEEEIKHAFIPYGKVHEV
jgi:hypothetical protein